jgi:hypothetical protein
MPELMEVIVAKGEALPDPEVPYYILAQEGLYLHRKTEIGRAMVKTTKLPYTVSSIGEDKNGVFIWEGDNIPGQIIGQATSFFRRIYQKHGTEAEVIITKHVDTGAYRLFVPYQRVSGASVKSIFDPTHIQRDWMVVGTMHSHCMMTAFHSGTDTNDANDMDGVHFTIGMVLNEKPQIVAMVSINKVQFHYRNPAEIADLDFNGAEAPLWWDNYVFPPSIAAPKEKPQGMQATTSDQWKEFLGITLYQKPAGYTPQPTTGWRGNGGSWRDHPDNWDNYIPGVGMAGPPVSSPKLLSQPTNESTKFNSQPHISKREAKRLAKLAARKQYLDQQVRRNAMSELASSEIEAAEWEQIQKAIDEAEESGLFHSTDWFDFNATELDTVQHWRTFFLTRLRDLCGVLDTLGMTVDYKATTKKPKQLPGQTTMADFVGV